jgi:hypothetical protein
VTAAEVAEMLVRAGHEPAQQCEESPHRFPDGARYRVEISSVERPSMLRAVIDEAERHGVPVRRVSQGSGVMMLSDDDIREMVELGAEHGIEISLFFGPRGEWDTGGQAFASGALAGAIRGARGLLACAAEARRACDLGIRGMLVADLGVLDLVARMRAAGDLPPDLVLKTSVMLPCTNPGTARTLESMGAGTLNVATDLTVDELGEIRAACKVPIDVYVESPDDQGGFVRLYDIADLVRVAAPLHLKFGLRNAPLIYPMGQHLLEVAEGMAREKVRRAALGLRLLEQFAPELVEPSRPAPPDLGVPVPVHAL